MDEKAELEKKEIEAQIEQELKEIREYLMDIRRRTGFGRLTLELKWGEIVDVEVTIRRRPKTEKKMREQA